MTVIEFYNYLEKELVGDITFYLPIVCKDGFIMSVQASARHFCHPKKDGLEKYSHYEVGFPSEEPTYFADYALDNIYPWVPVELIVAEINYHGCPLDA